MWQGGGLEETAQLVPPTLKYEAKSAEKSPSKVIEVEEPVNSKISLIFLCVTLGLAPSCKPKKAIKPSEVRKAGPTADLCPKPEPGSLGLRDPMRLAGLQLATTDVEVSETSISILPLNLAAKSAGLRLVEATAADLDVPPIFVMWKACLTDGKTCNNWARSYDFSLDNLAGLPSPFVNKPLKVNLRACVNDPSLIVAEERGKTSNSCTEASPCFCGNELSVSYAPAASTPADAQAAAAIEAAKTKLFNDSQTYINETNSYLASCTQDKGTALYEYAKNIVAYTPQELAYIVDSLGYAMIDFSSSLAQAAQSGAGLGLSEETMASCLKKPSGPAVARASSRGEDSWDEPFTPSDPGLTTEEETPDAPSTFTVASTETPPKEGEGVAPAGVAAKGKEGGGAEEPETREVNPTLLGLGMAFVVGGAVMSTYLAFAAYRGVGDTDFRFVFKKDIPAGSRTYVWHGRQIDAAMSALAGASEESDISAKTEKLKSTIDVLEAKIKAAGDLPEARARVRELRTIAEIEDPGGLRKNLLNPDWDVVRAKTLLDLDGKLFDKFGRSEEKSEYNRLLDEHEAVLKKLPDGELRKAAEAELNYYRGEADTRTGYGTIERIAKSSRAAVAESGGVAPPPPKRGWFSRGVARQQVAGLDKTHGWKGAAGPAMVFAMMIAGTAAMIAGSAGVGAQLAAGTGSCGDFASLALRHETQLKVDLDALFAAEETRP